MATLEQTPQTKSTVTTARDAREAIKSTVEGLQSAILKGDFQELTQQLERVSAKGDMASVRSAWELRPRDESARAGESTPAQQQQMLRDYWAGNDNRSNSDAAHVSKSLVASVLGMNARSAVPNFEERLATVEMVAPGYSAALKSTLEGLQNAFLKGDYQEVTQQLKSISSRGEMDAVRAAWQIRPTRDLPSSQASASSPAEQMQDLRNYIAGNHQASNFNAAYATKDLVQSIWRMNGAADQEQKLRAVEIVDPAHAKAFRDLQAVSNRQ